MEKKGGQTIKIATNIKPKDNKLINNLPNHR